MFIRKKKIKGKEYYYIVETVDGKQKVICYLGSIENILKKFKKDEN